MIFPPFLIFPLLLGLVAASSDYHERLILQPLAPASLLASFNFRSNASLSSFTQQNFGHFPRSLGQILQHAKTRELHLRFSTGRWDAENWGNRPWDGAKEGGTGVEIWSWVEAETEHEAFSSWITLNNALSGLFCASMNFIDSTRTTRPVMTFEPMGDHGNTNMYLLHGTLPREVVCTENLTPFLKLLPCKGKAGIASLLDGHKLFDATWQSMSIDVRPVCPSNRPECIVEMEQTIDMVLDIERSKRPRGKRSLIVVENPTNIPDNPIPRPLPPENLVCDRSKEYPSPDACYPIDLSQSQDWSLIAIFGRTMKGTCLASATETPDPPICINAPHELEVYVSEGVKENKDLTGFSRCLLVPLKGDFELIVPKKNPPISTPPSTPPLFAERSITGHGQERGGVRALLTNPSTTSPVEFVYFEALPWFMKPYIHTLQAQISSRLSLISNHATDNSLIKDMYYRPGLDRARGSQMELHMSIPPGATVTLTYAFEKAILRYTEYPPDANRGRDVAPAVIRLVTVSNLSSTSPPSSPGASYLRTTPLMLPLPTPDFSMPYNVIILTSTVIALAFGTIFNMLVRRFVGADEGEAQGLRAVILKIVARIKARVKALRMTVKTGEEKKGQ